MKALLKIGDEEVIYEDGAWFCPNQSLVDKLNTSCLTDSPASEPDPGGRDLELAIAVFGAEIIERTYDGIDPNIIY